MQTTKPAGERLKEARDAHGDTLDDAAQAVKTLLRRKCSRETIRRYEAGLSPETSWDAEIIAALAERWDKRVADLPPIAAERLDALHDVLIRRRACIQETLKLDFRRADRRVGTRAA